MSDSAFFTRYRDMRDRRTRMSRPRKWGALIRATILNLAPMRGIRLIAALKDPALLAVFGQDSAAGLRNALPVLLQACQHAKIVRNGTLAMPAHVALTGRAVLRCPLR